MSEAQSLLLILILLYLSDCLIWVKRESVAFASTWSGRWRLRVPPSWAGNANGGILLLNPLPPAGRVYLSHLAPISISPSGVCAYNLQTLPSEARSPSQTGQFLPFNKINSASADGVLVLIHKERFARWASARRATTLANVLGAVSRASASRRERMARAWISKQFALDEAGALMREGDKVIEPIRELSLILFMFLFAVTPLLVTTFGLLPLIVPIAVVMFIMSILIGIMFYRAHKRFFPSEGTERFESMAKMILCPPVSIRAPDLLTRNLLSAYSPLVLAELLTESREQQFRRAFVLDLRHPLGHDVADDSAEQTIRWTAEEQLSVCLEQINSGRYLKPEELEAPSQREEKSVSYCPRCRCQFVVSDGECPDCPGVGLVIFP
jgi:hypothetical protein